MTNDIIYTFGYIDREPEELAKYVSDLNAVIVDIRFSPRSGIPAWAGKIMQKVYGPLYCWVKKLGNRNFKTRGLIEIEDIEGGLAALQQVMDRGKTPILLCGCKEVRHL